MLFANKCALDKKQIIDAAKDGFKYVEFHTELNHFGYSIEDVKELRELLDSLNMICVAIHLPIVHLDDKYDFISFPSKYDDDRDVFINISKKAIDFLSILSSAESPVIVSHMGLGIYYEEKELNRYNNDFFTKRLKECEKDLHVINNYMLEKNSSAIFTIENMPYIMVNKDKLIYWGFGAGMEFPKYIKNLNLSNIRCCLDICHAEMALRVINMLDCASSVSIESYIEEYRDVLGHIHLNNINCLGHNITHHSTPFKNTKEDENYLYRILRSLVDNNVNCSITLEILEFDLEKRENIKETKITLNKVLDRLNLSLI